jgi:hypothetical protein
MLATLVITLIGILAAIMIVLPIMLNRPGISIILVGIILAVFSTLTISIIKTELDHKNTPQAIDVYRGKTELDRWCVIEDGKQRIDSIVVFKDPYK